MNIVRRMVLSMGVLAIMIYALLHRNAEHPKRTGIKLQAKIPIAPPLTISKEANVNRTLSFVAKLTRIPYNSRWISTVRSFLMTLPRVPSLPPGAEQNNEGSLLSTAIPPAVRVFYNDTWSGYRLPVITCDFEGRLGNVMSQYATMYAIHKLYNVTMVIKDDMNQKLKFFPRLSLPKLVVPYKAEEWQPVSFYGDIQSVNYASIELVAAGLLGPHRFVIKGTPVEIQLFHQVKEDIRKEFHFSGTITAQVRKFFERVVDSRRRKGYSDNVFVGFHVRMTDYYAHIQRFGGRLPEDIYFHRAITYFRDKFPRTAVFLAASDDIKYIKTKFETHSDFIFSPGTSAELDMAILSSCNHSIITVGSYGFWGGYLAGGEVVYPDVKVSRDYGFSRAMYEKIGLTSFTPLPVD